MTSFNAVGALLPLDEYWKNCVHPKPLIPPRYPGAKYNLQQSGDSQAAAHTHDSQARQAGHLRSYKDLNDSDDEEDEEVALGGSKESVKNSLGGSADSDFNSNVSQINYEMDDFNKTYCDESSAWQGDSSNTQQGRNHNANRSRFNGGQKGNVKSRLNYRNRWPKRNYHQNRNNHGNNQNQNRGQHQHQQPRLTMEQRMRYAYNSFSDNNNMDQSAKELMNNKNNFQNIPQNPPDMGYSNNIGSLIDSVSGISDNRTHNHSNVRFEITMPPLINDIGLQVNHPPEPTYNELRGQKMEVDGSAPDAFTVQQVARHVMLMMSTVNKLDHQETPEYFKSKKALKEAEGESQKDYQPPQGFN